MRGSQTMSEPKPVASLSPTLLARKGAARPAMRPQLAPISFDGENPAPFGSQLRHAANAHDDLGWNDMGDDVHVPQQDVREPAVGVSAPEAQPVVVSISGEDCAETPVVQQTSPALRQLEGLAENLALNGEFAGTAGTPRKTRSALKEGRKAAFTLRMDGHRHLRLRLACTLQNRSAQQMVTEALDKLLDDLPGLDELARRVKRH